MSWLSGAWKAIRTFDPRPRSATPSAHAAPIDEAWLARACEASMAHDDDAPPAGRPPGARGGVLYVESERPTACTVCGVTVLVLSATTPHPEAPEMLMPAPYAWIGFVTGDVHPEMVIVCSRECLSSLLSK